MSSEIISSISPKSQYSRLLKIFDCPPYSDTRRMNVMHRVLYFFGSCEKLPDNGSKLISNLISMFDEKNPESQEELDNAIKRLLN